MIVSLAMASAMLMSSAPAEASVEAVRPDRAAPLIVSMVQREPGFITPDNPLSCRNETSLAAYRPGIDGAAKPIWRPGAYPDAGWYSTVDRRIEGCQAPVLRSKDMRTK